MSASMSSRERARRSLASACSRACSPSTRTVTSAWMPTKFTSFPSASSTGEIDTWFQNAVPSAR